MRQTTRPEREGMTNAMDALLEIIHIKDGIIRRLEDEISSRDQREFREGIDEMMRNSKPCTQPGVEK